MTTHTNQSKQLPSELDRNTPQGDSNQVDNQCPRCGTDHGDLIPNEIQKLISDNITELF